MGSMILFTGCRTKDSDLYVKEKTEMVKTGVLNYNFVALSRDPVISRVISNHYHIIISL